MIRKYLIHLLITAVVIVNLTGCRTLQLNQDANVIGRDGKETSAGGGAAIHGNLLNGNAVYPGVDLNVEIQQRFGLNDTIEFQIKGHSDLSMFGSSRSGFRFYNHNVVNACLKVDLMGIQTHGVAIMPYIGLAFNANNTFTRGIRYSDQVDANFSFDPNVGFAVIASKSYFKRNLYYGGVINFTPDLAGICSRKLTQARYDLDLSFNIGWERMAYKVVYRNEFAIFTSFTFNTMDYSVLVENDDKHNFDYESVSYLANLLTFTFGVSYYFSASFRNHNKYGFNY